MTPKLESNTANCICPANPCEEQHTFTYNAEQYTCSYVSSIESLGDIGGIFKTDDYTIPSNFFSSSQRRIYVNAVHSTFTVDGSSLAYQKTDDTTFPCEAYVFGSTLECSTATTPTTMSLPANFLKILFTDQDYNFILRASTDVSLSLSQSSFSHGNANFDEIAFAIVFTSPGSIYAYLLQTPPEDTFQCSGSHDVSAFTSTPLITVAGPIENLEALGTFVKSVTLPCICKNQDCSDATRITYNGNEYSCFPVSSINNFKTVGCIFKKGEYTISNSYFSTSDKTILFKAPGSTINVKGTRTFIYGKNSPFTGAQYVVTFIKSYVTCHEEQFSNTEKVLNLVFTDDSYNLNIKAAGDISINVHHTALSNPLVLGAIQMRFDFISSGSLKANVITNPTTYACQGPSDLTDMKSQPVIQVSGSINNLNELGTFVKNITTDSVETPASSPSDSDKPGLSGGAIAGIVIGVIIVVGGFTVFIIIFMKKKANSDENAGTTTV